MQNSASRDSLPPFQKMSLVLPVGTKLVGWLTFEDATHASNSYGSARYTIRLFLGSERLLNCLNVPSVFLFEQCVFCHQ